MNEWSGWAATRGNSRTAVLGSEADRSVICEMLGETGAECVPIDGAALAEGIASCDLAVAILTEEALRGLDLTGIEQALGQQPPWSDFPFVLVAEREALEGMSELVDALGHVALVERPIHATLLRNAAIAALRSRARQREAEAFLLQREHAEEHLRQLTATLETRVRERMSDLREANKRLTREIKERQTAEEKLRESEELHRYTIELSQQMVWMANPDGSLLTMSKRYWDLTGLEEGSPPYATIHPDDVGPLRATWSANVASGTPHYTEYRLGLKDGTYRYFRARAAPRRDETGQIIRWYGTTEDINEQKEAELAREVAEERYRLAAQATNAAIWDLDLATGKINWAASENSFFGYSGRNDNNLGWWEERVHPDERDQVIRSLNRAIQSSRNYWSATYRFRTAMNQYADVHDQGFIIRDADGRALRAVGAMADVSEQKRSEAEIRRMQAELIHVSRLSAMGTMASTLAHEINQPLTAVSSYVRGSRRLLDQAEEPTLQQVRDALDAAEAAALRAGQIVRRLRELVARGSVSVKPEELPKLIQEANFIGLVDEHLHGITHRLDLDPAAEWVEVDRIQIQQVLINLTRNALQAMQNEPRREILICTEALSPKFVQVSVADTGPGISPELRKALFSPFQSTKMEGMGIGLSISRTIIEAHGGKIWAEDREGGGAVFRFTLPRIEPPGPEEKSRPHAGS